MHMDSIVYTSSISLGTAISSLYLPSFLHTLLSFQRDIVIIAVIKLMIATSAIAY